MITITCPHCGFSGKAPESAAGKQAKCRQCSKFFSVPSGHDDLAFGSERPTSKRRSPPPIGMWLIIGGIGLVVSSVVATLFALGVLSVSVQKPQISPSEPMTPATFRATVTYKYNNLVGHKPDTNSIVFLIPKRCTTKFNPSYLDVKKAKRMIDRGDAESDFRSHGAYATIVPGDGKAAIHGVKSGNYTLIIISANTNSSSEETDRNKGALSIHFVHTKPLGRQSVHFASITLRPGETTEVSHDFGLTYMVGNSGALIEKVKRLSFSENKTFFAIRDKLLAGRYADMTAKEKAFLRHPDYVEFFVGFQDTFEVLLEEADKAGAAAFSRLVNTPPRYENDVKLIYFLVLDFRQRRDADSIARIIRMRGVKDLSPSSRDFVFRFRRLFWPEKSEREVRQMLTFD